LNSSLYPGMTTYGYFADQATKAGLYQVGYDNSWHQLAEKPRVFSDTTARNTAFTDPEPGDWCFITAAGKLMIYIGAWWEYVTSTVAP
jgi:hypothetical protein